jgi:hypothetical protein
VGAVSLRKSFSTVGDCVGMKSSPASIPLFAFISFGCRSKFHAFDRAAALEAYVVDSHRVVAVTWGEGE